MSDDTAHNIEPQKQGMASVEAPDKTTIWKPALTEAAWAFLAAAILLIVTYTNFFRSFHPEFIPFMDRDARKLVVPGKDLIPVSVGAASKKDDQIIIEDFNEDEAVLLLPRAFQAEDYPFIKVNLSSFTRYSKFKIIWRRADNPEQTHALEFNRSGDEVTQIAMVYGGEHYRDKIADIALLFYDGPALGFENNNDVDIVIDSIEFLPFSETAAAEQILEDWLNPPLISGSSNNFVLGVHSRGMVAPNLAINLVLSISIIFVTGRRLWRMQRNGMRLQKKTLATIMCLCLYGWCANEALRWQWRAEQLLDAIERYQHLEPHEKIKNSSLRCQRYPDDCAEDLLPHF